MGLHRTEAHRVIPFQYPEVCGVDLHAFPEGCTTTGGCGNWYAEWPVSHFFP